MKNTPYLLAFVATLALVSTPTLAGFEFVMPVSPETSRNLPPTPSQPTAAPVEQTQGFGNVEQLLAPLPSIQQPRQQAQVEQRTVVNNEPQPLVRKQSMQARPAVQSPAQQPRYNSLPTQQTGSTDVVEGFGNNVPLVLAMTQIVPSRYQFIFDDMFDPNMQVSWRGGKAWTSVLRDLTEQYPISIAVTEDRVYVKNKASQNFSNVFGGGQVEQTVETQVPAGQALDSQAAQPIDMSQYVTPKPSFGDVASESLVTPEDQALRDLHVSTEKVAIWEAAKGTTLRQVLQEWSNVAEVSVVWSASYDYPLKADFSKQGTYIEAVQTLLEGLRHARPRPVGRLHTNTERGTPVLVVEANRTTG